MHATWRAISSLLFVLATGFAGNRPEAANINPESTAELAAAPRIVVADVVSSSVRWNDNRSLILTEFRMRTVEVLRGSFEPEFVITRGGGTIAGETHELSDLPVLLVDGRYLLVMDEADNPVFTPIRYGPLGAIAVASDGAHLASPLLGGQTLQSQVPQLIA